ncbi:MAG: VCBS repeat-containing protein, partial [Planctomycetota bacterium]
MKRFPLLSTLSLGYLLCLAPLSEAQFGDPFTVNGVSLRGKIVESGDIDADGDLDVVIADEIGQVGWRENRGAGDFGASYPVTKLQDVRNVTLADLDGDMDLDLVFLGTGLNSTSILAWHEFQSGAFGPRMVISNAFLGSDVEAADIDGDGDRDLVTCSIQDGEILYFENLGGGSFAASPTLIASEEVFSIGVEDVDGDGDLDILAGLLLSTPIAFSASENEGDGSFTRTLALTFAPSGRYREFDFGDMDGDGDLDVAAVSGDDQLASVWENLGDGS